MGLIFKPLKLLVFALAVYGILQIRVDDKKLWTHIQGWLSSQKTEFAAPLASEKLKWAKEEALNRLNATQTKIRNELKKNLIQFNPDVRRSLNLPLKPPPADVLEEPLQPADVPKKGKRVSLIPGTRIPAKPGLTRRQKKIIQKLDLENEKISGQDKKALESILQKPIE